VKIWNQDKGVLDTRVTAMHEAHSGQPAGTDFKLDVEIQPIVFTKQSVVFISRFIKTDLKKFKECKDRERLHRMFILVHSTPELHPVLGNH